MTDTDSTWFRDTPESRRLLEIERAKVEAAEAEYAEQAAAQLAAALDAWDEEYGPNPDRIVRRVGDHTITVAGLRTVLADRTQQAERIAELEADRASMAAEKERFRRTIALADDMCTCFAVVAARSKVRNEEDDAAPAESDGAR